jgi:hypothetical protein
MLICASGVMMRDRLYVFPVLSNAAKDAILLDIACVKILHSDGIALTDGMYWLSHTFKYYLAQDDLALSETIQHGLRT